MFKGLTILLLGFITQGVFASSCLTVGVTRQVCVGEKVYKGSAYSLGGKVVGVNAHYSTVSVQSISNLSVYEESLSQLHISNACLSGICTGDKVFKGGVYALGAIVMGINLSTRMITVKSINNGGLYSESLEQVSLSEEDPQFSRAERFENEDGMTSGIDVIEDIVGPLFDILVGETCSTVSNSSGRVLGTNIPKSEFVNALSEYARSNNSCVIGNEYNVQGSRILIDGRGRILGEGLSEAEASNLRNSYGYQRCLRATCN